MLRKYNMLLKCTKGHSLLNIKCTKFVNLLDGHKKYSVSLWRMENITNSVCSIMGLYPYKHKETGVYCEC